MSLPLSGPPEIDPVIDARFEVLGLVGAGGMGRVYRARDRASGAVVAVKVLGARADPRAEESIARFVREARVLASLDHPGIVRYLDAGETSERGAFLVMEWLAGHDLDERLLRGPLSVDEVIVLAKRLAEPLAAAHRRGIVHRDLKPANVLLVDGDVAAAKIIDFGLARREGDASLTAEGAVVGTPAYMAPEQIRGERVDARADVYALGALLFACLVGRPPFAGAHPIAVLAKAIVQPAPRASELRAGLLPALDVLIARLLAKDPDARPADGGEVARELAAIASAPGERPAAIAIGAHEQRVACIVLCDASASALSSAATRLELRRPGDDATAVDGVSAELELSAPELDARIEELGGTLYPLTQRSSLVTIRGGAAPAEQAARAARCALALLAARPAAPLVLATGKLVVGGSVQVGEVIDRAASILHAAVRGNQRGVTIDASTAALLDDRFIVRGDGAQRELVAERDREGAERTFLGRPSPCVGRGGEIASLEAALAACIAEPRSRAVLIVAPPGVGKSRLLQELSARVGAGLVADVAFARADPVGGSTSLRLAGQLVEQRARIGRSDSEPARARKLRAMIERVVPADDVDRMVACLGEIAGVYASSDAAPPELRAARADAATMTDVLGEAWVAWLRALTERRPLVVALEDLHWADAASLRLIDAALDRLSDRPLLVVGTARPEIETTSPRLWQKRGLSEIHLGPLPGRAARAFVESALGPDVDAKAVDAILERAAGHPFLLEELVRAVASGQGADALPTSVVAMVQARLDDLDAGARRVLRAASVFGTTFTLSAVEALLGDVGREQVAAELGALCDSELLQRRGAGGRGDPEHAFRHALLRDAAYATLTDHDRALAHRLAGAWLESNNESDPAVLAEHFDRGDDRAQALPHYRRAAKAALARSDLDRAAELAERALTCRPDRPTRGALLAIESEVSYWRGDLDGAVDRADRAAELLAFDSPAWFDAASAAIGALGQRGKNDDVAGWLTRVCLAESSKDTRGAQVVALCRGFTQLAWAHHRSDLGAVRARLEQISEPLDALEPYEAGWVHRVRAEAAWLHDGDVDRCLAAFAASADAFELANARRFACLTDLNAASLAGFSGDCDAALERAARARKNAERFGWRFLSSYARAVIGLVELFAGRAEGESTMRAALVPLSASPRLAFIARVCVGWAAMDRGDVGVAESGARAALETPVADELRPAARALLARALAANGALDDALDEAFGAVADQRASVDLELFLGLPEVALAEVCEARGAVELAAPAVGAAHRRLTTIAATIAGDERRARFWSRRMANDRLDAWARRLAVATAP